MGFFVIPRTFEGAVGRPTAEEVFGAVQQLIRQATEELEAKMVSRIDDKVMARYEHIDRRMNEGILGVEARLDRRITEEVAKLDKRITEVEARLDRRITEVEAKLEVKIAQSETRIIRWLVVVMVIQCCFMVVLTWASKHLF